MRLDTSESAILGQSACMAAFRSFAYEATIGACAPDMLHYRAEQQETTVSGVLEGELDGIASAHIEELSAALPGFAEAMAWPVG